MTAAAPLQDRRILVGICGGIAAYKTAALVSKLVQQGADVRAAMTQSAQRFVGPLTFESLTGKPVQSSQWKRDDHPTSQHVGLARWAQLMVIAPATANTLAKLAAGLASDAVTTIALALPAGTPVLLAPSMNAEMWRNPLTQRNLRTLLDLMGWTTVGPDAGWQACRTEGEGRMAEPDAIVQAAVAALSA